MTKQQLLRMAEFDEGRAIRECPLGLSMLNPDDLGNQMIRFCRKENTRLMPLITALVESREALREALLQYGPVGYADKALAADDARMKGLKC